ncbi:hypothetical protein PanWU01x14_359790 [Parasponia andersonii]|uniref:Uncharacterized protein n=1 Tax=Parasponia andersonii TaxID=3476 RepID=A0A2P5A7U5_PARAD|nr:hypothetical protein PanWU01x14_359790 [Parasponia andersonii]
MKCPEDASLLKRYVENDRIYSFLAGLNANYDTVRVQVLGKEDLPSLNKTISIIRGEENRRGVMLELMVTKGSAIVSNGRNNRFLKGFQPMEYEHGTTTNQREWENQSGQISKS